MSLDMPAVQYALCPLNEYERKVRIRLKWNPVARRQELSHPAKRTCNSLP